jgi:hypothetical protein
VPKRPIALSTDRLCGHLDECAAIAKQTRHIKSMGFEYLSFTPIHVGSSATDLEGPFRFYCTILAGIWFLVIFGSGDIGWATDWRVSFICFGLMQYPS